MKILQKINNPTLWVPESQFEQYARNCIANISAVPDGITEGLPTWVNYILNATPDPRIVLISDEINILGFWESGKRNIFNSDTLEAFLDHGFSLAEALGVRLWGINSGRDSMRYRTYAPLSFLSPVARGVTCHISPELRYDVTMGQMAPEDFWLRNIQAYRRTLRLNKYHYTMPDGVGAENMSDVSRLQARWGSVVEVVRRSQGKGQRINLKFNLPIEGL